MHPRRRTSLLLAGTLLCVGVLSACSSSVGSSGGDQGYISGRGVVTTLKLHERAKPTGDVSGKTLDGRPISLADFAGKTVVVNVWGAWCADCRAEAADLVAAAQQLSDKDVVFLGIDSRDPSRAAARAYVRRFEVPYPSIYDPSGKTLLDFRGTLTANSIPSTVVIDDRGRVAARVLGQVSRSTLVGIVEDVQSPRGSASGAPVSRP